MTGIELKNVSKRYLKGIWAQHLARLVQGNREANSDWFWALDEVSFSVTGAKKHVGIIGANGSGKTTLLRILSGVSVPTYGTVQVHGRVAPLLEPVAGMQPELTGKENIFLVGIILGMRRQEVQRKFDAIVDIAGVKDFLDMPVKHYSLGMVMRLGFSIAIHVDADIVLVDEAWSIGDEEFQNRSFKLLQEKQGHALLLIVSHDLKIIRHQTEATLWLHHGKVASYGPSEQVVDSYLKAVKEGKLEEARG